MKKDMRYKDEINKRAVYSEVLLEQEDPNSEYAQRLTEELFF